MVRVRVRVRVRVPVAHPIVDEELLPEVQRPKAREEIRDCMVNI